MPFTLVQVDNTLKSINTDGVMSAALTLPTDVQIALNLVPRFARFKRYVVMVNSPTRPLSIDVDGVVRNLTPTAPASAVALSGTTAGTLTGTYLAKQTYVQKDSDGNVISESDFSPAMSTAVAIVTKKLHAAFVLSNETISATRLYRTATNGSAYFKWADVDGNITASYEDDQTDASLALLTAPSLGAAPDLTLICEWQGRLWGVDRDAIDDLRFTESGTMYAWYSLNTIPIAPVGSDSTGIVALIPRRNSLGVGRKNHFSVINGTSLSNFTQTQVQNEMGVASQESVVIYKDTAFFLWRDGIYTWGNDGFKCITDGKVRSWFTTDTYFNRAMFWRAFAELDPISLNYRLFLASAGSNRIDRWIEYDLTTGAFFGPHLTSVFQPTCAVTAYGANQQPYPMVGSSEGFLSLDQEPRNDWGIGGIALSAKTKAIHANLPDYEKYWGELSILGKAQASGTVTVTPTVGDLDAAAGTAFSYDMTRGRQRLRRLGRGKHASIQLDHSTINEDVLVYGYEVNPVNVIGRR